MFESPSPSSAPIVDIGDANLYLSEPGSTRANNKSRKYSTDPEAVSVFSNDGFHLYSQFQLTQFAREGISGVAMQQQDGRNMVVRSDLGMPLRCIDASAYFALEREWKTTGDCSYQPFKVGHFSNTNQKLVILPIVGDIHANGKVLTAEQKEKLLLAEAPNAKGETVKIRAFLQGGRGMHIFGYSSIPVAATSEGGFEIVPIDHAEEFLPTCSTQYGGIGLEKSTHFLAARDERGNPVLGPDDVVLKGENVREDPNHVVARRQCYFNLSGIFCDLRHEHYGDSPTGGCSSGMVHLNIERDALLLRKGAKMAGVVTSSIPLFTKRELEKAVGASVDMPCEELSIFTRSIFQDSHRLSIFTDCAEYPDVVQTVFHNFILSNYGEFNTSNINKYLGELSSTLGHNARICLESDFSLKSGQQAADNLGLYGGIFDSENFYAMTNLCQGLPLVSAWLGSLFQVVDAAKVPLKQFLKSKEFLGFISSFFGIEVRGFPVNLDNLDELPRKGFVRALAADITADWITINLIREGKKVDTDWIRSHVRDNARFREAHPLFAEFPRSNHDATIGGFVSDYVKLALLGNQPQFGGAIHDGYGRTVEPPKVIAA